jgi:hypothetical protein
VGLSFLTIRVVTAAELLAFAAFRDGKVAQAFPSFGSERTGAPVTAFCRINNHPRLSKNQKNHSVPCDTINRAFVDKGHIETDP